ARQWQGALFHNFRLAVFISVLHSGDHALRSGHQIHRTAHALEHFPGDGPVGEVPLFIHLERTEYGDVDVSAADHAERFRTRKIRTAGNLRDGFFSRIDQVRVLFTLVRIRSNAEHAVFGLRADFSAGRQIVWDKCGQADAEVHVVAVAQLARHAAG